ncbi:MAG TPA: hypothetical protein VNK23_15720 [Candidatus Dormibacteraeota bacterium]|nr:hypothetical protein [Candidatus Dormibacteraeota bacterium]
MAALPGVEEIKKAWATERWSGIEHHYTAEDIERLRGSAGIEHSLADMGARRLWELLHRDDYLRALGDGCD